jgi:hypothetical protein
LFSCWKWGRAFTRVGLDLWRKPIAEMFRPLTDAELQQLPADIRAGASSTGGVYFVSGWPATKPLVTSWSHKSRMYPPGDLLLMAPVAAVYHFTAISFRTACRLLLAWLILATHIALYWFLLSYFEGSRSGIEWLGLLLVYFSMMRWTLEGFYDASAMIPLILCARYLGQRRSLAAIVAYCVGAFIHFRVFFLAPWVLYAALLVLRDRAWRQWTRRDSWAVAVAVGCGMVSLYVFWLDLPALRASNPNNPLLLSSPEFDVAVAWNFAILLVACGGLLLWSRAWLDAVVLAWLGVILFKLREFYWWHLLISMSWIGATASRQIVHAVRIVFFMTVTALALQESLASAWLWRLFR